MLCEFIHLRCVSLTGILSLNWYTQFKLIKSVLKLSEMDADFQSKLSILEAAKLTATELHSLASLEQALMSLVELTRCLASRIQNSWCSASICTWSLEPSKWSPITIWIFSSIHDRKMDDSSVDKVLAMTALFQYSRKRKKTNRTIGCDHGYYRNILREWLLTQRNALPCIRVIAEIHCHIENSSPHLHFLKCLHIY